MELKVNKPKKHAMKVIACPKEKMNNPASDYKILCDGDDRYNIITWVTVHKDSMIPSSLIYLSIGKFIESDDIWKLYPNSEYIYFFIVEKQK